MNAVFILTTLKAITLDTTASRGEPDDACIVLRNG